MPFRFRYKLAFLPDWAAFLFSKVAIGLCSKRKEERLCFANALLNGRAVRLSNRHLARMGCFILPEWACGEGCFEGNIVSLESLRGSGNHSKGSQAFCYFLCAKSKRERLCFANALLNGRIIRLSNRHSCPTGLPFPLFNSLPLQRNWSWTRYAP